MDLKATPLEAMVRAIATCALLLPLSVIGSPANAAAEFELQAQSDLQVHKRRLLADPDHVATAPTSVEIEYAAVTQSPKAASDIARRALRASRDAYGADDVRTAGALINLAVSAQRMGSTDAAVAEFELALKLIAAAPGGRQAQRFEAWYGLGITQLLRQDPAAASRSFDAALQVYAADQGPFADRSDALGAQSLARSLLSSRAAP
jgi:tetratricopeptide (TPR) repeat protein